MGCTLRKYIHVLIINNPVRIDLIGIHISCQLNSQIGRSCAQYRRIGVVVEGITAESQTHFVVVRLQILDNLAVGIGICGSYNLLALENLHQDTCLGSTAGIGNRNAIVGIGLCLGQGDIRHRGFHAHGGRCVDQCTVSKHQLYSIIRHRQAGCSHTGLGRNFCHQGLSIQELHGCLPRISSALKEQIDLVIHQDQRLQHNLCVRLHICQRKLVITQIIAIGNGDDSGVSTCHQLSKGHTVGIGNQLGSADGQFHIGHRIACAIHQLNTVGEFGIIGIFLCSKAAHGNDLCLLLHGRSHNLDGHSIAGVHIQIHQTVLSIHTQNAVCRVGVVGQRNIIANVLSSVGHIEGQNALFLGSPAVIVAILITGLQQGGQLAQLFQNLRIHRMTHRIGHRNGKGLGLGTQIGQRYCGFRTGAANGRHSQYQLAIFAGSIGLLSNGHLGIGISNGHDHTIEPAERIVYRLTCHNRICDGFQFIDRDGVIHRTGSKCQHNSQFSLSLSKAVAFLLHHISLGSNHFRNILTLLQVEGSLTLGIGVSKFITNDHSHICQRRFVGIYHADGVILHDNDLFLQLQRVVGIFLSQFKLCNLRGVALGNDHSDLVGICRQFNGSNTVCFGGKGCSNLVHQGMEVHIGKRLTLLIRHRNGIGGLILFLLVTTCARNKLDLVGKIATGVVPAFVGQHRSDHLHLVALVHKNLHVAVAIFIYLTLFTHITLGIGGQIVQCAVIFDALGGTGTPNAQSTVFLGSPQMINALLITCVDPDFVLAFLQGIGIVNTAGLSSHGNGKGLGFLGAVAKYNGHRGVHVRASDQQ